MFPLKQGFRPLWLHSILRNNNYEVVMTACKNTQNQNVNLYLDMKCCILLIYPKETQARMIENLT